MIFLCIMVESFKELQNLYLFHEKLVHTGGL